MSPCRPARFLPMFDSPFVRADDWETEFASPRFDDKLHLRVLIFARIACCIDEAGGYRQQLRAIGGERGQEFRVAHLGANRDANPSQRAVEGTDLLAGSKPVVIRVPEESLAGPAELPAFVVQKDG